MVSASVMLDEKSRLKSILKLETDVCLTAAYQHIIYIENTCAQLYEIDSVESVIDTVVRIHMQMLWIITSLQKSRKTQKKNLMILCFTPKVIGYEEFYKDSLNC